MSGEAVRLSASALDEGRFDRAERLGWFDLPRLRASRALVVGCGALGNEVVKNLALTGVGHLDLVDMDRVVVSNLPRCSLFTTADATEERPKAEVLARAASRLDPGCRAEAYVLPIEKLDEAVFTRADVVVTCVDNIGTRVFANARAMQLRKPLVDGGTRGTVGKVQVVLPDSGACLECTMNASHMRVVNERASCTGRGVTIFEPKLSADLPTTAIVAAIQSREAVKLLHGKVGNVFAGMFYYDGMANVFETLETSRNDACPHHDPPVNP